MMPPTTRAQNAARGRKAKASGDRFEEWVNTQHEKAKHLGIIAHVAKNEPRVKIIDGRLEYEKAGVSDYSGTLEGGRSLVEEAKSTQNGRFLQSSVTPKQQMHLTVSARAGALALLLVEFCTRGSNGLPVREQFAIPWLDVPWNIAISALGISAADVARWRVITDCYLQPYHPGGRSTSVHGVGRHRIFPRE